MRKLMTAGVLAAACGLSGGAAESPEMFFGVDSACSWLSRPKFFKTPTGETDLHKYTVDRIDETGFRQVRERLSWNEVNPKPDKWDYSHYLRVAKMYGEKGIRISGMFHDAPAWAEKSGKLPTDLKLLYDFCKRTGETFGGLMEDWEFWNEEDIGFCGAPAWEYVSAMKAAYLGFKDARPAMPVLMGALCHASRIAYDDVLFANDLGLYTDAMNFHTYSPLSSYPSMFAELRKFLADRGLGDLAIWVTESGTHQEGRSDKDGVVSGLRAHSPGQERLHAEIAAKSQLAMLMEGVSRDYFFCYPPYNEQGGHKDWGVMRRDGTLKPAAKVFSEMIARLGKAKIVGEVDVAKAVKGYAFRQPDGSFTLAYVSVGRADSGANVGENDQAPDVPFEFQGRALVASAYPKYLDGLGELKVVRPAVPRGRLGAPAAAADEDRRIVLQLKTDPADFTIGGGKSTVELKKDSGRVTVVVYNFDDQEKTGTVSAADGHFDGLPASVVVPAWGKAELSGVYRTNPERPSERVVLSGLFGGRRTSRLTAAFVNPTALLKTCDVTPLALDDDARWERNTSADEYESAWDPDEKARRFHLVWKQEVDRWAYPRYKLKPGELQGAILLEFEIKSRQDKVENDFATANVFLFQKGRSRTIGYSSPLGTWERRCVDLSMEKELDVLSSISIGANPNGHDLTYWIRNVRVYRQKQADKPALAKAVEFKPLPQTMIYGDAVRTHAGRPFAKDPTVIRHNGRYLMYYSVRGYEKDNCPPGCRPGHWTSAVAESRDLMHWTRLGEVRFAPGRGPSAVVAPCVKKFDGRIHIFAQGEPKPPAKVGRRDVIWHGTSEDGLDFTCPENMPMFVPKNGWSIPRAIDAEVYRVKDQMVLIFATRESPGEKVQQLGMAVAPYGGSYEAASWRELTKDGPLLKPERPWEMNCLEAATVIERKGVYYMFYAGAYNHERQQIGLAYSTDGCHYTRFSDKPILTYGAPGSWNAWESGHPGVFQDDDGRVYLFYQGKATLDGDYALSCLEVIFRD